MLALLIGLLAAAGPVLRGSWDLWAQSALFIAVSLGFGLWLAARIFIGYVPRPSSRLLIWSGALALAAGLSAALSPVPAAASAQLRALLLGLWIFPAMAALSKDDRSAVDQAVRLAAWALVLLACYQKWQDGMPRPPSALLNQNVFAGALLLLLPIAVQLGDWPLAGGLVLCLWWTGSVGAWLGLAGALVITRRRESLAWWGGAGIGFICLVALYAKLQSPEVSNRWQWWSAAAGMIAQRPWTGYGPGSFGWVLPGFEPSGRSLSTLFAHQHWLETGAELGLVFLGLWTAGLLSLLKRGAPHKRFGALAILIQSLWDYALAIPGVFWLFCYCAASTTPESSRGINIPSRAKALLAAAVLAASGAVAWTAWDRWQADRLKAEAVERLSSGGGAAALALLERSLARAADPEAEKLAAELELVQVGRAPEESLRRAAERLERAVALDPYRASLWIGLERLYARVGDDERSARARRRGAQFCPILRERR